jgi:hypothetical protein
MTTIFKCTIVIENIDIDNCGNPHYISDALYVAGIAHVSRITLQKYKVWSSFMQVELDYYRAYVEIHEWLDTESAYDFIQQLDNDSFKFVHSLEPYDTFWTIRANYCLPLICHDPLYKRQTTIFYLVDSNDSFIGDKNPEDSFRTIADDLFPVVGSFDCLTACFEEVY